MFLIKVVQLQTIYLKQLNLITCNNNFRKGDATTSLRLDSNEETVTKEFFVSMSGY